jgi:hypothetical protein
MGGQKRARQYYGAKPDLEAHACNHRLQVQGRGTMSSKASLGYTVRLSQTSHAFPLLIWLLQSFGLPETMVVILILTHAS